MAAGIARTSKSSRRTTAAPMAPAWLARASPAIAVQACGSAGEAEGAEARSPRRTCRGALVLTADERVKAVIEFGFTERQARFLVLVMRHAGVCVPRQYASFAGVAHGGAKCNAFFDKLVQPWIAVAGDASTTAHGSITCITSRCTTSSANRIASGAARCQRVGLSSG